MHAQKIGSFHAEKAKTINSLHVGSSIKSNAISELHLPSDDKELESQFNRNLEMIREGASEQEDMDSELAFPEGVLGRGFTKVN